MSAKDWRGGTIEYRRAPGVSIGTVFECFCGRRMKQQRGDTQGWYCRRHGLQAYETN